MFLFFFFFQAEDGIRDVAVTRVQTCALPILWVTPVQVNHTVPTTGFIIHDGSSGLIYSGDTGPTETLWRTARGLHGLRAVILECAFPNRLGPLAEIAKHRSEEHTSELQSRLHLVCRLLLGKKKIQT